VLEGAVLGQKVTEADSPFDVADAREAAFTVDEESTP
jgi:hypothetical protein